MFHFFPLLPPEIRRQIWKAATGDGRFLKVDLKDVDNYDDKTRFYLICPEESDDEYSMNSDSEYEGSDAGVESALQDEGRWVWATNTAFPALRLLRVNREAHDTVYESYEQTSIWRPDQHRLKWTRVLVDYSKDTFYFSKNAFEALRGITKRKLIDQPPFEFESVQNLALESILVHPGGYYPDIKWDSDGSEISRKHLSDVLQSFPAVKHLQLAIDCGDYRFEGDAGLWGVEEEFKDEIEEDGRQKLLSWSESLVIGAAEGNSDTHQLEILLKILINGRTESEKKSCISYFQQCCRFVSEKSLPQSPVVDFEIDSRPSRIMYTPSLETHSPRPERPPLSRLCTLGMYQSSESDSDSDSNTPAPLSRQFIPNSASSGASLGSQLSASRFFHGDSDLESDDESGW